MKKKNLIIFILVIFASCNYTHVSDTNNIILDLNSVSAIDIKTEISLSGLEWSTELIPLETSTEESFIRDIEQIKETRDFFWILGDLKVFQFGKDGSFKRQIGKIGQGPEDYLSAQSFSLDEKNKELYIMDYFGRKMAIFDWNGSFKYSFPLPEDYSFNSFFLSEDGTFYFHSFTNAIMPDILLYNPQTQQSDTLSYREREMGMEGFMGNTTMYDLNGNTYVYHYFNDTVYTIRNNQLHPAWFIYASKLMYRFDELDMSEDFTPTKWPNGPRIKIEKVIETPEYIFVFYTLDKDKIYYTPLEYEGEKKFKKIMAMYNKIDKSYYPHVHIISDDQPWISLTDDIELYYSSYSNSLLRTIEAAELSEYNVINGLKWDDNPVIVRYSPK